MNIDMAVAEARRRIASGPDELATWILDTFALPLARIDVGDMVDVEGWGHDVVEIGERMTGSWCAEDALGIATVIVLRAEDARDELRRSVANGRDT